MFFVVQKYCDRLAGRRLVGEAYVHGLMNGQSARECDAICKAPLLEQQRMGLIEYWLV